MYIGKEGSRILERDHCAIHKVQTSWMYFDMRPSAAQTVEFYCDLCGIEMKTLKHVTSPGTSRGGGLRARHVQRLRSTSACETTVLARLSRPDLAFMVGRLASNVSRWSQWDDRQLLPVISYLNTTRICHCWNSITWL